MEYRLFSLGKCDCGRHRRQMHDIRFIRDTPEAFDAGLARRGLAPQSALILAKDEQARLAIQESEALQAAANASAKAIGAAMAKGDRETADMLKAEVGATKARLPELEGADSGRRTPWPFGGFAEHPGRRCANR